MSDDVSELVQGLQRSVEAFVGWASAEVRLCFRAAVTRIVLMTLFSYEGDAGDVWLAVTP